MEVGQWREGTMPKVWASTILCFLYPISVIDDMGKNRGPLRKLIRPSIPTQSRRLFFAYILEF